MAKDGSAELFDSAEQQTGGAARRRLASRSPPNDQLVEVYSDLTAKIDAQPMKLSQIVKTDVPASNQVVKDQNIPAIVMKPPGGER